MDVYLPAAGSIWTYWTGDPTHRLYLDPLTQTFLVDAGAEFLPVGKYLEAHPARRGE